MDKKRSRTWSATCYRPFGREITAALLDELKDLGFAYATQAGITVGIDDVQHPGREGRDHRERPTGRWSRSTRNYRDGR